MLQGFFFTKKGLSVVKRKEEKKRRKSQMTTKIPKVLSRKSILRFMLKTKVKESSKKFFLGIWDTFLNCILIELKGSNQLDYIKCTIFISYEEIILIFINIAGDIIKVSSARQW